MRCCRIEANPRSPGEIARSLAVRYQVEGSVRQSDDRLRVSAQLVDADGRVLWSGRFDEALADLFALQDKITTQIVEALALRVSQSEQRRVFAKPTDKSGSLRLRAARQAGAATSHPCWHRRSARAAQARDPARSELRRRLLRTRRNLSHRRSRWAGRNLRTQFWRVRKRWPIRRSASTTPTCARMSSLAVFTSSIINTSRRQVEIDRAIAINPNDALGLAGRGNILMWLGQTDAAISTLEQAQRIDPELNPIDRNALGLAYYQARRYDAAIAQAELNLRKTESASFSYVTLAAAYAQQNRVEEAARSAAAIRRMDPTFDPQTFGSKFLNRANLDQLRDGLRKAGLFPTKAGPGSEP